MYWLLNQIVFLHVVFKSTSNNNNASVIVLSALVSVSNLEFVSKDRSGAPERLFTQVGSGLTYKH